MDNMKKLNEQNEFLDNYLKSKYQEPTARMVAGKQVISAGSETMKGYSPEELKRKALQNLRDKDSLNLKQELSKLRNDINSTEDETEKRMLERLQELKLKQYEDKYKNEL